MSKLLNFLSAIAFCNLEILVLLFDLLVLFDNIISLFFEVFFLVAVLILIFNLFPLLLLFFEIFILFNLFLQLFLSLFSQLAFSFIVFNELFALFIFLLAILSEPLYILGNLIDFVADVTVEFHQLCVSRGLKPILKLSVDLHFLQFFNFILQLNYLFFKFLFLAKYVIFFCCLLNHNLLTLDLFS